MFNVEKDFRPKSAFSFFVQIYCKKKSKHSSKYFSKIEEASKSWLSLSDVERQEFIDQYEECLRRRRKQYAAWLQKTEPYLLKKKQKNSYQENESKVQESRETDVVPRLESTGHSPSHKEESLLQDDFIDFHECSKTEDIREELKDDCKATAPSSPITGNIPLDSSVDYHECSKTEDIREELNDDFEATGPLSPITGNVPQDSSVPVEIDKCSDVMEQDPHTQENALSEPLPPCVKTAKELYDTLNTDEDSMWTSVPDIQKKRYQRVVLALKKDYINKYKTYLESLSSRELFEHYCNKTECDTYVLFTYCFIIMHKRWATYL